MNEFEVFVEAAEKEPGELVAYLSEACAGKPRMRERIHALLSAHHGAGFLDTLTDGPPWHTPIIQGYKLLEQIGEGTFGNVYMAEQVVPMRRRVAVKVVKLGMDTKQVVARFDAERQAMAMMDHPSIASVYDAGATDSGRPYFAMELVRGESITEFCDRERFRTRRRLELIIEVCRAIQHAHQKGIIHRDIKPNNVLVTNHDGKPLPKVIDFGIAKATEEPLTEKTLFTQFRQMIGTPAYMSPEQAEMNASDIDTRSDIYSVGVLMYELLTSKPPLELKQSSYEEILREIRETEPQALAARLSALKDVERSTVAEKRGVASPELVRMVKGDLNWIVSKALSKDRSRRYETASALADDIERYLKDQPILASPPSATYRLSKFVRRNRVLAGSTAAIVAALLIGLAIAVSGQIAAKREAVRAQKTFEMLRDLLIVADPAEGFGPNYTVRAALDDFATMLPDRMDGSMPDVEAEIYSIIGNAYGNLTFRYDAEPFLTHAVELRKTISPLDQAKLAAAYEDLADNAMNRCRILEGMDTAKLAIESYQAAGMDPSPKVLEILKRSKELLAFNRHVAERISLFEHDEVVEEVYQAVQEDPENLSGTLLSRAIFLFLDVGDYEKAISVCQLTPADFRVKYSDQERNVRATLNGMLLLVYREHNQQELADQLAKELRHDADGDELWFENNPWQRTVLALAILHEEGCSEADKGRALRLAAKQSGDVFEAAKRWPVAPEVIAASCHAHVLALIRDGRFELAQKTLRLGLDHVPPNHPFLRGLLERQLAEVLENHLSGTENLIEAERVLRGAVEGRAESLGDDFSAQNSVAEMNLALFLQRHTPDDSRPEILNLLESASRRVSHLGPGNHYFDTVDEALLLINKTGSK